MAAQAGLCLAWSETPEDTFCRIVAHLLKLAWSSDFSILLLTICFRMFDVSASSLPLYHNSSSLQSHIVIGERGGSVVECRTPEREVGGSKPTSAVLCPWARHFTPRKYWLITQEAVAPSRHDWKIVDWDVKPQHKQTNKHIVIAGVNIGILWWISHHIQCLNSHNCIICLLYRFYCSSF